MSLTFAALREANVLRCNTAFGVGSGDHLNEWTPSDWLMATTGELGELANMLKKRLRGDDIPQIDIEHEVADVAIYLDLLAARLGSDLGEAVRRKFNQVSARKNTDIRI